MADIVGSLFGFSSQELMNQQRQNDQNFATNVANIYQDPGARIGALIGANLGGGLARGVFNIQDPQIKAAQDFEAALAEAQQSSTNPAEAMMKLAEKLGSDPRFARQAAMAKMKAQELEQATSLNQAKIANEEAQSNKFKAEALKALRQEDPVQKLFFELAKNASPKSVATAVQAGGDISLLDSPETKKFSPLAQQLIDAGFEYGTPQFNQKMLEFLEADKAGKAKGSGNVSVSIGPTTISPTKVSEEAGKVVGKAVGEIENKYSAIDSIQEAKNVLEKGINAGFYGPSKTLLTKATGVGSTAKVQNTEEFISYIGNTVVPRLQEFGGNDSVEELKYLQGIMGGNIQLEPASIKRILESAERKIQRGIERLQRQEESARKGTTPPLDAGPSRGSLVKPTKRWNPKTKSLEVIQ